MRDFFHGCGEIELKEAFTSTRLVTDAIKTDFRIRILDESASRLRCKIVRFGRLYAFPVFFPNPTLDISLQPGIEGKTVNYCITCYDYYTTLWGAFIFGIGCSALEHTRMEALKSGLSGAALALVFFGILVFLDTKYLLHRIRKALSRLNV